MSNNVIEENPSEISYLRGTLITHETRPDPHYKFLTKLDIFSFLPVPKDEMVSTNFSLIGSIIFLVVMITYIIISFYYFVTDNSPSVEMFHTKLNEKEYELPRISLGFMVGEYLNETAEFSEYWTYNFTQELKATHRKWAHQVNETINDPDRWEWLGYNTIEDYPYLRSPAQKMYAKGLLYSSNTCNYSKVLISMCDVNNPNITCKSVENISSLAARGRVFLFIEDMPDNVTVSKKNEDNRNRFLIANFFLEPLRYKRVTVSFKVVETTVYPDFFYRFTVEKKPRLELVSITEQSSNTSIINYEKNEIPLEMLGIVFVLSPQMENVIMTYFTLISHVASWGAFFNLIFTIFAIFFLSHNRKKFYEKNPDWDKFRNVTRKKLRNEKDKRIKSVKDEIEEKIDEEDIEYK